MNFHFSLTILSEIDQIKTEIQKLDRYDPITSIIKERFQQEITEHLTSLKSVDDECFNKTTKADCKKSIESLKKNYIKRGRQQAVSILFFELIKKELTQDSIKLLNEILFDTSLYRSSDTYQSNKNREKIPFEASSIVEKSMSTFIDEYNVYFKKHNYHPLIAATYFHHKFTSIHPFVDGNGRIGRLLLNIFLMQNDYLPILIQPDERNDYYSRLEKADNGDIVPLTEFFATKELKSLNDFCNSHEFLSIKGKYELEQQLKKVSGTEKCIVLTEDSTTSNLLQFILSSSGFNMDETNIISYEGCSKLGSANLFSIFVKEKMPNVKIIVHRDRDYLTEYEIDRQRQQFTKIDVHFFVTIGTDIESYFIGKSHLSHCHPTLSSNQIESIYRWVLNAVKLKSIDYLRKKEFGGGKSENYTHLNQAIVDLVENNLFRFTHGKTAKATMERRIQSVLNQKSRLDQTSPALCIKELKNISESIWGK